MADRSSEGFPRRDVLSGIGVSPGIAIGPAYLIPGESVTAHQCLLHDAAVEAEVARFKRAVATSKDQLEDLKQKLSQTLGREHTYILDTHVLILEDKTLIRGTVDTIRRQRCNAEWALQQVVREFARIFDRLEDPYLRERRADVAHVAERVLRNLAGHPVERIADLPDGTIVVAHDLSPADTLQMEPERVKAFVTDIGGRTSHTAITARSLEIPAVVGLGDITGRIRSGDTLVVDGHRGLVIVNPDQDTLREYRDRGRRYRDRERELEKLRDLSARTRDGYEIRLSANLDLPEETATVQEHGATGVGLLRTEYLFMNRSEIPTEEEHFKAYKTAAEALYPHPVVVRTLDLGGDKMTDLMGVDEEANPALGLRAIRFCLKRPEIFKAQLRAILRASAFGEIRLLYPMVSGITELRQANYLLEEAKEELAREGLPFRKDIQVGIMIEVPSAALMADVLALEVSFMSVGTNDLIQYALAVDRQNEHVAYLYEPLHPAVLRLLARVVEAGHQAGIPVSMCGEMAGDPFFSLVLLGLGFDELSMAPLTVPLVKKIIRSVTMDEARTLVERIKAFPTASEAHAFVYNIMRSRFPEEISAEGEQVFLA